MIDVANRRKKSSDAPADKTGEDQVKTENRSPSWQIFARVDPALQAPVEQYINSQEYPPALARVLERALKDLLIKHKLWPPKQQ